MSVLNRLGRVGKGVGACVGKGVCKGVGPGVGKGVGPGVGPGAGHQNWMKFGTHPQHTLLGIGGIPFLVEPVKSKMMILQRKNNICKILISSRKFSSDL